MNQRRKSGQLRIIGGEWRGRKLAFPAVAGLRPTPDRVRETLFNWLQGHLPGARCLDLFAGSGALGLEALSRGAAEVVFVEHSPQAAEQIRRHLETLHCPRGKVINIDACRHLNAPGSPFDVVFLDPPYDLQLLEPCCRLLHDHGWLKPGAHIYLEARSGTPLETLLPPTWEVIKQKSAGDVGYHLALAA